MGGHVKLKWVYLPHSKMGGVKTAFKSQKLTQ